MTLTEPNIHSLDNKIILELLLSRYRLYGGSYGTFTAICATVASTLIVLTIRQNEIYFFYSIVSLYIMPTVKSIVMHYKVISD